MSENAPHPLSALAFEHWAVCVVQDLCGFSVPTKGRISNESLSLDSVAMLITNSVGGLESMYALAPLVIDTTLY
ncbi:unnamed protein product [Fusarium venenatum]|uniref:Uncharacterized protein n=1 Tax=Fusarium venenatum TaxID=56646 RepID=A0A2L2T572_9HYPO|nr:uncharacterized protein FVRRES_01470 [Fusarium venenatum]CEI64958.1 unnamed protein product [Fusarium venenatum]